MASAVHSPGASNPQNRRNVSEKPSSTVIAVMSPCRYPTGKGRDGWSAAGGDDGLALVFPFIASRPVDSRRKRHVDHVRWRAFLHHTSSVRLVRRYLA